MHEKSQLYKEQKNKHFFRLDFIHVPGAGAKDYLLYSKETPNGGNGITVRKLNYFHSQQLIFQHKSEHTIGHHSVEVLQSKHQIFYSSFFFASIDSFISIAVLFYLIL